MVAEHKSWAITEAVQDLECAGRWDDALEHVPEQTLCLQWVTAYAFFVIMPFCLEGLCSANFCQIYAKIARSVLTASVNLMLFHYCPLHEKN